MTPPPLNTDAFAVPGRLRTVVGMVEEVAVADWRDDPRAACILASFAKHPPATREIAHHDRWTSATDAYAGYRVECLDHVYGEHLLRLQPKTQDGDWSKWDEFRSLPEVQEAIEAVVNPPVVEPEPSVFDMMMAGVVLAMRPRLLGRAA